MLKLTARRRNLMDYYFFTFDEVRESSTNSHVYNTGS
jgi:hypothetical protein